MTRPACGRRRVARARRRVLDPAAIEQIDELRAQFRELAVGQALHRPRPRHRVSSRGKLHSSCDAYVPVSLQSGRAGRPRPRHRVSAATIGLDAATAASGEVNSTKVVMVMCLFSPAVPAGRPFTPPQHGPGPESLS